MKLSDALRFSWDRLAEHPSSEGFPIEASDFGITMLKPSKGFCNFVPVTKSWTDMDLETRHKLLRSEQWEPVDPKPAMLVLAEAYALDWSDPEPPDEDEVSD